MNVGEAGMTVQQRTPSALPTSANLPASEPLLVRLASCVAAFLGSIKVRRRERTMHLCETLPLGDKRFLALVEVEKQRFLIASTNQSISLLHSFPSSHQTPPASSSPPNSEASGETH